MSYDPASDIQAVKVPVLALNGENDRQVSFPKNLERIKTLLPKNKQHCIKSYPKLNHLFQTSETGSPMEYYAIEETISPNVLADISSWITAL